MGSEGLCDQGPGAFTYLAKAPSSDIFNKQMWKKPLRNVRTAVFVAVQCPSDGPISIDQSNWKIDKSNVKCRKQDGKYGNTEKIPPNI